MNEYIDQLRAALEAKKLSDAAVESLLRAFTGAAKNLDEDEEALKQLVEQFHQAGEQVAAAIQDGPAGDIRIDIQSAQSSVEVLSKEDIMWMTEEHVRRLAERTTFVFG